MGANETLGNIPSIQPDDTHEIEWPLDDLDMKDDRGEELFSIRVDYSDIFDGQRFIDANYYVTPHSFPKTRSLRQTGFNSSATERTIANPSHIRERKIQFRSYSDDLQQEAKEYAEANKAS